jgi:hypothetical protein
VNLDCSSSCHWPRGVGLLVTGSRGALSGPAVEGDPEGYSVVSGQDPAGSGQRRLPREAACGG